jgi:hypothetical protein
MQRDNSKIIIFCLKNRREDYAKCLRVINFWLAKNKSAESFKEVKEILQPEFAVIADIMNPNAAARYLETPMQSDDGSQFIIKNKRSISEKDLEIPWEKLRFHVRIKLNDSAQSSNQTEMLNFQYLALLMRTCESKFFKNKQKRKLTFFIVPQSGDTFPFNNMSTSVDYETYKKVSYYLRLLSHEYNGAIFGVDYSKGKLSVNPLDFKLHNRTENFFPLLHVDEKKYKVLFDEKMDNQIFDELQNLNGNTRFGLAGNENPDVAFKDFIIEASYTNLKYKVQDVEPYLRNFKKIGEMSVMQFALFCFTFCERQENNPQIRAQQVSQNYMLVRELTQGVRQIVQNSIQHSQLKECFFRFICIKYRGGRSGEFLCTNKGKLSQYQHNEYWK